MPKPTEGFKRVTFDLPEDFVATLRATAKTLNVSQTAIIEAGCTAFFAKARKPAITSRKLGRRPKSS